MKSPCFTTYTAYNYLFIAHELSEERIVEIFTFFIKSSQNNPEVIEEFMTVLSQEECRQYWSNERTRILLQGFLKDIMFQPAGMFNNKLLTYKVSKYA